MKQEKKLFFAVTSNSSKESCFVGAEQKKANQTTNHLFCHAKLETQQKGYFRIYPYDSVCKVNYAGKNEQ
jgi:hypothetical protein